MHRALILLLLLFNVSTTATASTYNGKLQVACTGCASSVATTANFARKQVAWIGWSGASNFYVYDTARKVRRQIRMQIVYSNGKGVTTSSMRFWSLLLRSLQGTAAPDRLRVKVYTQGGRLLRTEEFLLANLYDSWHGEPWQLVGSNSYLSDFGGLPVAVTVPMISSSIRLGSTREAIVTVNECYGECEANGY